MNKVEQNKLGHYDWMIIYLFWGLVLISYPCDMCCNGIWAFITSWSSFLTSAEIRQRGLVGSMGPWKMRRMWGLHSKMRCWDVPFEQHPDGTVILGESEICHEEFSTAIRHKLLHSRPCHQVLDQRNLHMGRWSKNVGVKQKRHTCANEPFQSLCKLSRVCVLHSSLFLLGEQKSRHWYVHE